MNPSRALQCLWVLASWGWAGWAAVTPEPASAPEAIAAGSAESRSIIALDGQQLDRTFEGLGALSAGASSRLLIDYPEPQRREILDLLFQPHCGASFQHLKVEVGGDVNSTDGCEPSHMRTRRDLNFNRGYEWWLMREARQRNPAIYLDCLQWGAPAWIGAGHFYSQDNADYLVQFLQGARKVHGLDIAYVGIWNETRYDTGWIKRLRRTLDRHHLGHVQIVAADEINRWSIVDVLQQDPALRQAVQVVGTHYPKYRSTPAAQQCGKPLWASEDGPWDGTWKGATALARMFNRNFIEGRMTKTIIWSPVTAYYDNLPLPGSGVMKTNSPWSGHYEVQPALWVVGHTTQFAAPGWKYLGGAGCGFLPKGGSYVGLRAPDGTNYSVIIEITEAQVAQEVTFALEGGLAQTPVHVWQSTAERQFERGATLGPTAGRFTMRLEPGSVYSLTTTTGQRKGAFRPPAPAPLPLPYHEDFEEYPPGATPRYFADQAGIFETARAPGRNGLCLHQVIRQKGIEWPLHLNPFPETFLGDLGWKDYAVSVDVRLAGEGYVALFGRVGKIPQSAALPESYLLKLSDTGAWELGNAQIPLLSGDIPFRRRQWHNLRLELRGEHIRVRIDGQTVGEIQNRDYATGMVGLGSGWHEAAFDNLRVEPLP